MVQILQLDVRGMPQEWITPEDAAIYYATDSVAWTVGSVIHTLHGGTNAVTGLQSRIDVHAIVATTGASRVNLFDAKLEQPQVVPAGPYDLCLLRWAV